MIQANSAQQLRYVRANVRVGQIAWYVVSHNHDDVEPLGQVGVKLTQHLAHEPFGSVALDGVAEPLSRGEAVAIMPNVVRQRLHHEPAR